MPSEVPSRLFFGAISSGTNTFGTVTTGHTFVIKGLRITNTTSGPLTILIGINGVAAANQILNTTTIAAGATLVDDGLFIMMTTDTLQMTASSTGLTICASGIDHTN